MFQLTAPHHSLSLKGLRAGTDAQEVEKYCLLDCRAWFFISLRTSSLGVDNAHSELHPLTYQSRKCPGAGEMA